jgi:hypothetical protein
MNRTVLSSLLAVLVVVGVAPTRAQTVTSYVEGNNGGTVTTDTQGPSASAVTSSLSFPGTARLDFSADGFGEATQSPSGVGAVAADAYFVNGQTGNYVEARTTWTNSTTNNTGGPIDYVFDFSITPAALRIRDDAGLPDAANNAPDASFLITIRANSAVVFSAGASLFGGDRSYTLTETGTSLSPSFVAGSVFGYDFAAYGDILSLGTVADGATITVEYEMIVRVDTPGFEAGGSAQIGDPFDLSGTPGFVGVLRPDAPIATSPRTWGNIKATYK